MKVILGLLVPIYIKKLDFKTREELQSMPQTEEEHLENQYLDYEEHEKSIADAEVSVKHSANPHLKPLMTFTPTTTTKKSPTK
jgi:transient receptor potential cation channel subfamily M protein 3